MASITIPNADSTFAQGTCAHCGKVVKVKIDPLWYRVINACVTLINEQLL